MSCTGPGGSSVVCETPHGASTYPPAGVPHGLQRTPSAETGFRSYSVIRLLRQRTPNFENLYKCTCGHRNVTLLHCVCTGSYMQIGPILAVCSAFCMGRARSFLCYAPPLANGRAQNPLLCNTVSQCPVFRPSIEEVGMDRTND